jgi:hypothetical protein
MKISGKLKCKKKKKKKVMTLKAIPQQEFQKCFQQWQHQWAKCTAAQEGYFEGDLYQ